MSSEVTTYPTGKFAVAKDPKGVERFAQIVRDNGVTFGDLPKLKIPGAGGRVWEVATPNGVVGVQELEVVIVITFGNRKAWWAADTDSADSKQPPNCASNDGIVGFGNHSFDQDPKHASTSHDCLTCPMNQFGSERKNERGKDCKDFSLLMVFTHGTFLPLNLKIPATSLKALKRYLLQDLASIGLDSWNVVTRLKLTPKDGEGNQKYSLVEFSLVKPLEGEEAARFSAIRQAFEKFVRVPATPITAGDYQAGKEAAADSAARGATSATPTEVLETRDTTATSQPA